MRHIRPLIFSILTVVIMFGGLTGLAATDLPGSDTAQEVTVQDAGAVPWGQCDVGGKWLWQQNATMRGSASLVCSGDVYVRMWLYDDGYIVGSSYIWLSGGWNYNAYARVSAWNCASDNRIHRYYWRLYTPGEGNSYSWTQSNYLNCW